MMTKPVYNTVWRILALDPNLRTSTLGMDILVDQPILIEHCATSHYLASDSI